MGAEDRKFDGRRLRAARERKGYSRPELAELCRPLSVSAIRNHEQGRNRPRGYVERKYEEVLGVPPGGFRDGAPIAQVEARASGTGDALARVQEIYNLLLMDDLGQTFRDRGDLRRASDCFTALLQVSETDGDAERKLLAHMGLGMTYTYFGRLKEAMSHLEESRRLARACKDRAAEGRALRQLGVTRYLAGELADCGTLLEASLDLAIKLGEHYAEIRSLIALANLDRAFGRAASARARGEEALRQAERVASRRDVLHARIGLAFSCVDLADFDTAQLFFVQSLGLAQELRDLRGEAQAFGVGAVLAYARRDLASAGERAAQSLGMAERIGDRHLQGWALGTRAAVLARSGDIAAAMAGYRSWLEIAGEIGDRRGEAAAHWYLGRLHWQRGERKAAFDFMNRCVRYEVEMNHPRASAHREYLEALGGGSHRGR
jgi:tetratricopeptide (TPR) repeat protein